MIPACAMEPEIEAAFDGRFGAREVERVERHLASCAACRALQSRLAALRDEARAHDRAAVGELDHRRARAALLRAAATMGGVTSRSPWCARVAIAVAAAAVTVTAAARPWRAHSPRTVASRAVAHPRAEVDALDGARWSRDEAPHVEVIRLTEGMLRVRVPHQHADHRFVVALPDGEVEVRGTQFLVEVRASHTARVSVFEGVVAVRVGGRDERLVTAGAQWTPPVTAPTPESALAPVSVPAPVSAPAPSSLPRAPRPFLRFAEGVDALGRGDFAAAADAFARFERQRPGDERADDAAWLRVVSLRRGGNEPASRDAAEHYLATYASGAHRGECARIVARDAIARGDCARLRALRDAAAVPVSERPRVDDIVRRCAEAATR